MAKNTGRRKRPKQELKGRRLMPPPLPLVVQEVMHKPLWKRIPRWVYLLLVLLTLAVTSLQGYPWLSIQRDDSLSSTNPFRTTFSIANEGYIPITDIDVDCTMSFSGENAAVRVFDNTLGFEGFARQLVHGDRITLPCFQAINEMSQTINGVDFDNPKNFQHCGLTISISYALVYVNFKRLRRSQNFNFATELADDHSLHWVYLQSH
jgi:hypothetical protein